MSNLYDIIGVKKDATQKEIKHVYRKLALELHPDKSIPENKETNEKKFKDVSNAYAILSDPEKRKQYDRESMMNNISAEDIFKKFGFGNFFNTPNFTFKQNVHVPEKIIKVDMTLEEMWTGCVKEIHIDKKIFCDSCKGDGCKEKKNCDTCKGTGQIKNVIKNGFNVTIQQIDCQKCQKRGYEIVKGCDTCNNSKFKSTTDKIKLSFKPGVNINDKILLQNRGDQITKDNFQNVIILVNQLPHILFTRNGNNLYIKYEMDFNETLFGTTKNIYHINGEQVTFTTDEVINPNKIYKMEGLGFNGGDLEIKFNVEYNTNKNNLIEYLSNIINKDKIKEIESDRDHNKLLIEQIEEDNNDVKQQCVDKDNIIRELKQKEDDLVNQVVNLNESLNDTIKQLQDEMSHKNELLSNKNQVVSQLQEEVNNKEQFVSEVVLQLQEELNGKDQVVLQLQEELNGKYQVVLQLQEEVNGKDQVVLQLQQELKVVSQLQEELNGKDQVVLQLQEELNGKDQVVLQLQEELNGKDQVVSQLQQELNGKDQVVSQLQEELNGKDQVVLQLQQELNGKDQVVSQLREDKEQLVSQSQLDGKEQLLLLQRQINEKNVELDNIKRYVTIKDGIIEELRVDVFDKSKMLNDAYDTNNVKLNEYKQYLAKKDGKISELILELETKDMLIMDISDNNTLQQEINNKNNTIQELLNEKTEKEELIKRTIFQMNESNEVINSMKRNNKELTSKMSVLNSNTTTIQQQLNHKDGIITKLNEEIKFLHKNIDKLSENDADINTIIEDNKRLYDDNVSNMEVISKLNNEMEIKNKVVSEIDNYKDTITTLKEDVTNKNNTIEELKMKTHNLKQEMKELTELQDIVGQLHNDNSNVNDTNNKLHKELQDKDTIILQLSNDKDKLTKAYDNYEMKCNEGKDTIKILKTEIYSHKNTIHELQEVVKHYEPFKIIPIELTLEGIYNGCYKNIIFGNETRKIHFEPGCMEKIIDNYKFEVIPISHPVFKLDRNDIRIIFDDIEFKQSLYGIKKVIKHLNNKEFLFETKEVLDPSKDYRMKGLGINGGDLIVNFSIIYPELNKQQLMKLRCVL